MRIFDVLTLSVAGIFAMGMVPATAASPDQSAAIAALKTIQRDATAISAGRYTTKAELQSPAREIALSWSQAADALGKDGSVRVEMKIANDSITKLERDWQSSDKARSDAKSVTSSIGDLIAAAQSNASSS